MKSEKRYIAISKNPLSLAEVNNLPSKQIFLQNLENDNLARFMWNSFKLSYDSSNVLPNLGQQASYIAAVHLILDICDALYRSQQYAWTYEELTAQDIYYIGSYLKIDKYTQHTWILSSVSSALRSLIKRGEVKSTGNWYYVRQQWRDKLTRQMSYRILPLPPPLPSKKTVKKCQDIWDNDGIAQNTNNMVQADKKKLVKKDKKSTAHTLTLTLALDDEQFSAVMDFLKNKKLL